MGYVYDEQAMENDAHAHVVIEDYKLYFINDSGDESGEDSDNESLYEELWEETPYSAEPNWYQEDLDHPSLLPKTHTKFRHATWIWQHLFNENRYST